MSVWIMESRLCIPSGAGSLSSPGNQDGAAGPGNNGVLNAEDGETVGGISDNQES